MVTKKEFPDRIEYRNDKGILHREDGPAVEWSDGSKEWYIKGELHREEGPAREWINSTKEWCINGQYHREDGPAREFADGTKQWFLNGKGYSEQEHQQEVIKIKLQRLKSYGN